MAVCVFVNFLETQRFFEGDSPRLRRSDEAQIANEEDALVVDGFFLDAVQLGR